MLFLIFFSFSSFPDHYPTHDKNYGIAHSSFFPWFQETPIFRRSTLTLNYKNPLPNNYEGIIWDIVYEINQEICIDAHPGYKSPLQLAFLDKSCKNVVVAVPSKKSMGCKRRDGRNEICFNKALQGNLAGFCRRSIVGSFDLREKRNGLKHLKAAYDGGAYFSSDEAIHEPREIFEADVVIDGRTPGYLIDKVLKHEILHSLGFGHTKKGGIMEANIGDAGQYLEVEQLENWKRLIKEKGGFVEVVPVINLN